MKKVITITVLFIAVLSFSLAYAIHELIPAETMVPLPGPYGSAVYKYIAKENTYTTWSLWPGTKKRYKAKPPLDHITTYINDNARFSIIAGEKMANGSIIVTENYDDGKELDALFVMYKVDGYNPSAGDWFWAQYDEDGKVKAAGKVKACIDCHTQVKSNDYIFTEEFVK